MMAVIRLLIKLFITMKVLYYKARKVLKQREVQLVVQLKLKMSKLLTINH